MLTFNLRLLLFVPIWLLILLSENQQTGVYLLFFCALSLAIYFIIPILKRKLILVGLLQAITISYGLFLEDSLIFLFSLLSLLYCFDSAFYIKSSSYRIKLLLINCFLLIGFVFVLQMSYKEILVVVALQLLLSCILYVLNVKHFLLQEKITLYEELLGEYRRLKRHATKNEMAVRVEERARIAREMHDSVGHKLTALSMQIEMLLMKEKNDMLLSMKNTVNESLEETRKAVRALTMDDIEGISSVIQLIRKLESESQLRVNFTTKQGALSLSLSNKSSIVLYRVLQESLTNAMKYGSSREINVTIGVSPIGEVSFEIMNKYNHTNPFHEGFGLKSMRQRVEQIGGKLHIYQLNDYFITEGTIPVEEGSN